MRRAGCALMAAPRVLSTTLAPQRRALAHRVSLSPNFHELRGTWPRPRFDYPSNCGRMVSLVWGPEIGPYMRHLRSTEGDLTCNGGGTETFWHRWAKEELAQRLETEGGLDFYANCHMCEATFLVGSVKADASRRVLTEHRLPTGGRVFTSYLVYPNPPFLT